MGMHLLVCATLSFAKLTFRSNDFVCFRLYVSLGSLHCVKVLLRHLNTDYMRLEPSFYCVFSYLFPGAIYNWLFTNVGVNFNTVICILVLYGCFSTGLGCAFMCGAQCMLVARGQTPFEFGKGIRTYDRGLRKNFAQLFGKWWVVNFLIPLPTAPGEIKAPWGQPTFYKSV